MSRTHASLAAACLLLGAWACPAADAPAGQAPQPERQLKWEHGAVTIGDHVATIALPDGMSYLQSADARYVLEQVYNNPPDPGVLGLVRVPMAAPAAMAGAGSATRAAASGDADAGEEDNGVLAIISYDLGTGHVKDDDAASTDYDKLLKQMQGAAIEAAPELRKQGFEAYALLGWAEPPHYDAATKVLYWAESAKFERTPDPVLNYKVRILGARGVLEINFIDQTKHLATVRAAAAAVMPHVAYASGNAYSDFQPGHDKVAEYGIGGLIAGGALYGALKLGFFGLIGKFLIAFIKPIIVGTLVACGAIAKLFRRSPKTEPVAQSPPAAADRRDQA